MDLVEVVGDILPSEEPQASAKGLELVVNAPTSLRIRSDPARVRQILLNLVSNAIKFTERGRVTIAVAEFGAERVALSVSDTGPGIPAGWLDDIFEEFTQLHRRTEGTGLGLAISRRLAHLLGGTLTVTSDVGRGSKFVLT